MRLASIPGGKEGSTQVRLSWAGKLRSGWDGFIGQGLVGMATRRLNKEMMGKKNVYIAECGAE